MWSFDISQPYRPPRPVTRIALLCYFAFYWYWAFYWYNEVIKVHSTHQMCLLTLERLSNYPYGSLGHHSLRFTSEVPNTRPDTPACLEFDSNHTTCITRLRNRCLSDQSERELNRYPCSLAVARLQSHPRSHSLIPKFQHRRNFPEPV
jgi:hypothetical protein